MTKTHFCASLITAGRARLRPTSDAMDLFGCGAGGPRPIHILYRPDVDVSAASIVAIADLAKQIKEQKRRVVESKALEEASQREVEELRSRTDAVIAETRKVGPVATWLGEMRHRGDIERAERRADELGDAAELEQTHYEALRLAISAQRRRLLPNVWRPVGGSRVEASA